MDTIKRDAIKVWLAEDLQAADVKWSLFFAAAHNYRHDTVLRPFPAAYLKGEEPHWTKDHDRLVSHVTPCLATGLPDHAINVSTCLGSRTLRDVINGR